MAPCITLALMAKCFQKQSTGRKVSQCSICRAMCHAQCFMGVALGFPPPGKVSPLQVLKKYSTASGMQVADFMWMKLSIECMVQLRFAFLEKISPSQTKILYETLMHPSPPPMEIFVDSGWGFISVSLIGSTGCPGVCAGMHLAQIQVLVWLG